MLPFCCRCGETALKAKRSDRPLPLIPFANQAKGQHQRYSLLLYSAAPTRCTLCAASARTLPHDDCLGVWFVAMSPVAKAVRHLLLLLCVHGEVLLLAQNDCEFAVSVFFDEELAASVQVYPSHWVEAHHSTLRNPKATTLRCTVCLTRKVIQVN